VNGDWKSWFRSKLPFGVRQSIVRMIGTWDRFCRLTWLQNVVPSLYAIIEARRIQGYLKWLRNELPDFYERLTSYDMPDITRRHLLNLLSMEPYRDLAKALCEEPIEADVVYVHRGMFPDMIKAVIALKKINPKLRCVALVLNHSINDELAGEFF